MEEERRGHRERWTEKEKWSDINVNNILLKLEQSAGYVCGEKMSGEDKNSSEKSRHSSGWLIIRGSDKKGKQKGQKQMMNNALICNKT